MPAWDVLTSLCLCFTATITPYEVSFLSMPASWDEAWCDVLFIVNRIVDAVFVGDMALQFVLMYQDHSRLDGVKWIDEPRILASAYLRSWFIVDLVSLCPSIFDMVPLGEGGSSRWRSCGPWRCLVASSDHTIVNRFKVLRVLRVSRAMRILRLLSASADLRRLLQIIVSSGPAIANVGSVLALVMFIYAVLGMNMFTWVMQNDGINAHANFESFGNASTPHNPDSSRFGKFVMLHFHTDGRLAGVAVRTYLLETTRVVRLGSGERCFHVFHELLAGGRAQALKAASASTPTGGFSMTPAMPNTPRTVQRRFLDEALAREEAEDGGTAGGGGDVGPAHFRGAPASSAAAAGRDRCTASCGEACW